MSARAARKRRHRWSGMVCLRCCMTVRQERAEGQNWTRRYVTFPGGVMEHRVNAHNWPRCGETGAAWAKRTNSATGRSSDYRSVARAPAEVRRQGGRILSKRLLHERRAAR